MGNSSEGWQNTETKLGKSSRQKKRPVFIWLIVFVATAIIIVTILWFFIWRNPDDNTENEKGFVGQQSNQWDDELEIFEDKIVNIISEDAAESYERANRLYEDKLNEYPDDAARKLDITLDYARALILADRFIEAQNALLNFDIDSFERPDDLDNLSYIHEKLEYYALLRKISNASGQRIKADEYNQKIIELSNEESKLSGETE